jgi:hypothetical protein
MLKVLIKMHQSRGVARHRLLRTLKKLGLHWQMASLKNELRSVEELSADEPIPSN